MRARTTNQRFVMDVVVRVGARRMRANAFGRDIYAVSAPLAVEALRRLLTGNAEPLTGVRSLGEIFDARHFLETLSRAGDVRVDYHVPDTAVQSVEPASRNGVDVAYT